jgi:transcriptional regulator GlxA family with amidase domain
MRKNRAMHRVVVLALNDVVAFDLGVPAQVFGSTREASGARLYSVTTCTADGRPVRTTAGFQAVPDHGLDAVETADTVIVPGIHRRRSDVYDDVVVAKALCAARDRGTRVMSICTGAFVLAAAGLLDDRRATTHWYHAEALRRQYPRVKVDPDVLFVDEGDVLTSAGVSAGIDLCLHVVRKDHGSGIANRAARRCVMPAWREGGQAQYIERPLPRASEATTTLTREWVLRRLGDPLTLRALAAHANMSVRTFTRRFREETGASPAQWMLRQRIDHARVLLETTGLSVDQVAKRAGLGSATSLRQHLHRMIGVAPTTYRRTFAR